MSRPRGLTEERIVNLRPAPDGKRYDFPDGAVPNLFVRVGAEWNALLARGLDPKEEKERTEAARVLAARRTFGAAMEDYIAYLPSRQQNRHVLADTKAIRRDILNPARNPWRDKPMADVADVDVSTLVKAIRDRGAHRLRSLEDVLLLGNGARTADGLRHKRQSHSRPTALGARAEQARAQARPRRHRAAGLLEGRRRDPLSVRPLLQGGVADGRAKNRAQPGSPAIGSFRVHRFRRRQDAHRNNERTRIAEIRASAAERAWVSTC
ncbi:hypothetical protein [Mesorhizobium sp. KR1-2]|uniref:hypothetical protein n=1 Tax=Mesorhizobium sp. KR1-2 TaxID=3156609 RepID=UPI0032B35B01